MSWNNQTGRSLYQMKQSAVVFSFDIVTKEYVKGRENVCVHPLVQEIPKHVDCANRTLGIIGKIIVERGKEKPDGEDPLNEFRM